MTLPECAYWTYLLKVRICCFNALPHACLPLFNHYSPSQLSFSESLKKGSCRFFDSLWLLMSVSQSLRLSLGLAPRLLVREQESATVVINLTVSTNLYLLTLHLRNLFPLDVWLNCIKWLLYQPSKSREREKVLKTHEVYMLKWSPLFQFSTPAATSKKWSALSSRPERWHYTLVLHACKHKNAHVTCTLIAENLSSKTRGPI